MKNKIIKYIKSKKQLYTLLQLLLFVKNTTLRRKSGLVKKYPKVIQLPITYKCNSKCVMCNIWKMDSDNEMNLESFSKVLKSDLFKKVVAVGINGGEPSLVKQLPEYIDVVLKLPKLKSLSIISHGFNQKMLLPKLKAIYQKCKKDGVTFNVSISLDGVGDIYNTVRGLKVFDITASTIDEINKNKSQYCDAFDVGCTVIKHNVNYLSELSEYARSKNINIKYRLGISNKRIESNKLLNDFSVFNDKNVQTTKEFFYSRIGQEKKLYDKFKYFSIYYFLNNNYSKRLFGCFWQNEGITLDSKGNIYYCAVESDKIGNLLNDDGVSTFFLAENLKYRQNIIDTKCDNCIHDYAGNPKFSNIIPFIKELYFRNMFTAIYKFLSKF